MLRIALSSCLLLYFLISFTGCERSETELTGIENIRLKLDDMISIPELSPIDGSAVGELKSGMSLEEVKESTGWDGNSFPKEKIHPLPLRDYIYKLDWYMYEKVITEPTETDTLEHYVFKPTKGFPEHIYLVGLDFYNDRLYSIRYFSVAHDVNWGPGPWDRFKAKSAKEKWENRKDILLKALSQKYSTLSDNSDVTIFDIFSVSWWNLEIQDISEDGGYGAVSIFRGGGEGVFVFVNTLRISEWTENLYSSNSEAWGRYSEIYTIRFVFAEVIAEEGFEHLNRVKLEKDLNDLAELERLEKKELQKQNEERMRNEREAEEQAKLQDVF